MLVLILIFQKLLVKENEPVSRTLVILSVYLKFGAGCRLGSIDCCYDVVKFKNNVPSCFISAAAASSLRTCVNNRHVNDLTKHNTHLTSLLPFTVAFVATRPSAALVIGATEAATPKLPLLSFNTALSPPLTAKLHRRQNFGDKSRR